MITPLAPAAPYIAVAEASFNTSILSTSLGERKLAFVPTCTPSTTYNGLALPFIVATPRIRMAAFASGAPSCEVTITPAAAPCNPCKMFVGAFFIISSLLLKQQIRKYRSSFEYHNQPQ